MNNVEVIKHFTPFNIIKKVCGYARVSTEDEHQDSSFRLQLTELENDIKANPNYQFIGIFKDKKSGRSTRNRSEFNIMIELAKNKEIDIIYTKSITRFARNILDAISIVRELKLLNVEVVFQKENISSLDPQTEFVLSILAMQAEEESKNISENTKWSIKRKIHGGYNLTSHLYGYRIKGETWTIVKDEAKVVRMIFDMYLKNVSYKQITEKLYAMGIKTRTGKPKWHPGTIESMLQNEKFAGHMALGKTYIFNGMTIRSKRVNHQEHFVRNHHEPIISSETYFAAIRLRESRTRNKLKTYIPLNERVTSFYQFVFSELNNKHLQYVMERPKGKYEIPTLFCYNKQKKNRVMVTVNNLFLILNDALVNISKDLNSFIPEISNHIESQLLMIEENADSLTSNPISYLTQKLVLTNSKDNLSSFIKKLRGYKALSNIDDFRDLIQRVIIKEDYNFIIKLKIIENEQINYELFNSSINLKVKSKLSVIKYSVYI